MSEVSASCRVNGCQSAVIAHKLQAAEKALRVAAERIDQLERATTDLESLTTTATPRTDALELDWDEYVADSTGQEIPISPYEHARQLERELIVKTEMVRFAPGRTA